MKTFTLLLTLLLVGSVSVAQKKDFKSFSEDSYAIGDEIILSAQMFNQGARKLMPENFDKVLEVAKFLEKHRKIQIEIYCYSNEKVDGSIQDLCEKRAKSISDRLVLTHDIAPKRLKVMGWYEFAGLAGGPGSQKMVLKITKV